MANKKWNDEDLKIVVEGFNKNAGGDYRLLVLSGQSSDLGAIALCENDASLIKAELKSERTTKAIIRKCQRLYEEAKDNLSYPKFLETYKLKKTPIERHVKTAEKFIADAEKKMKVNKSSEWKDKVTINMLENFNYLNECLELPKKMKISVMTEEELRKKIVTLQRDNRRLVKKVSKQKAVIGERFRLMSLIHTLVQFFS